MKYRVNNYTFDASLKTVTFNDINPIELEGVLLIINVVDNIIIYNFADSAKGGSASTNVLTLTYDTTSMSDTDELMIFYDDGVRSTAVGDGTDTIDVAAFPSADGASLGNQVKTANFNLMYNGTSWDRVRGSTTNGLTVNLGANNDVTATGNVAHDAADSGNPLKSGGKAFDFTTSSSGEIGQTAVAANDRVNQALTLRGETPIFKKAKYEEPTNIDTTYNNTTTTATSAAIDVNGYSQFVLGFDLTKNSTPTDLLIEVEVDLGDGNYKKLMNNWLGDWRYDDTAVGSGIEEAMYFQATADNIRITVTATGTDATKTFTMANSVLRCMV